MKTNMRKADVKKQIVALALAAVFALPGAALAADTKFPLTPNSGSMEFDHLKRHYEIPNFRIGGKYNLDADPETWRNGGEGGTERGACHLDAGLGHRLVVAVAIEVHGQGVALQLRDQLKIQRVRLGTGQAVAVGRQRRRLAMHLVTMGQDQAGQQAQQRQENLWGIHGNTPAA